MLRPMLTSWIQELTISGAVLCTALVTSTARAQNTAPTAAPAAAPAPTPVPAAEATANSAPAASPAAPAAPVAGASTNAAPSPPPPDTNNATMSNNLTLFGSIGYGYGYGTGFGAGIRYQIAFVKRVLKLPPGKHDEFGLEFGMDYYHVGYHYSFLGNDYDWSYNEFTPVIGVTWNFWLTDRLAVYPKIDFGYRFVSWNSDVLQGYDPGLGHFYFQGTGGVVYDVGPVKLRAEIGWVSVRFGVALALF